MRSCLVLLLAICVADAALAQAMHRPNVVLMMADDMGLGDTSAYQDFTGNQDERQIHTPHMERLARMGVRFTDAHTPSSRCTPTRYGLLTGRYPWRNRLKHWVLFGVQGDPMIEADRPTIATLLKHHGYRTGLTGKWHLGLRYRRADGLPADGWEDADLRQPLFDTPLDHGFDECWLTSRSHGTSGPTGRTKGNKKRNHPKQSVGPGMFTGGSPSEPPSMASSWWKGIPMRICYGNWEVGTAITRLSFCQRIWTAKRIRRNRSSSTTRATQITGPTRLTRRSLALLSPVRPGTWRASR